MTPSRKAQLEQEAAWMMYEWIIEGKRQTDIAEELGISQSTVNARIVKFTMDFTSPDFHSSEMENYRRRIAVSALDHYISNGGVMQKPERMQEENIYRAGYTGCRDMARYEHAWLLRAEGLTYEEIGLRMGIGKQRASYLVHVFSRQMNIILRRTRIRWEKTA